MLHFGMPDRIAAAEGLPDGRGKPVKRREYVRCQTCDVRYEEEQLPLRTWNGQPEQVLNIQVSDESPKNSFSRYFMHVLLREGD